MIQQTLIKGTFIFGIGLLAILPAFANSVQITITATVKAYNILRIEESYSYNIMSKDTNDPMEVSNPEANEILDFGELDALGSNNGSFTTANGTTGTIIKKFINTDNVIVSNQPQGAEKNGTIYYVNDALVLRLLKSDNSTGNITVTNSGNLTVIVGEDMDQWVDGVSKITNYKIAPNTSSLSYGSMMNNTVKSIDIGIYIPLNQVAGSSNSIITFTSS